MRTGAASGLCVVTRFVLLASQRTGSTWVIDTLNGHPEVTAYSELFLHGGVGYPKYGGAKDLPFYESFVGADAAEDLGSDRLERYLERVFRDRSNATAIGFKLMYGQATAYPGVRSYLRRHEVRVVHLVRHNLLDVVVSMNAALSRCPSHRGG